MKKKCQWRGVETGAKNRNTGSMFQGFSLASTRRFLWLPQRKWLPPNYGRRRLRRRGLAFDRGWGPASVGSGGPSLDQMMKKFGWANGKPHENLAKISRKCLDTNRECMFFLKLRFNIVFGEKKIREEIFEYYLNRARDNTKKTKTTTPPAWPHRFSCFCRICRTYSLCRSCRLCRFCCFCRHSCFFRSCRRCSFVAYVASVAIAALVVSQI